MHQVRATVRRKESVTLKQDLTVSDLLSHLQKAKVYLTEPYISGEEFTKRLREMEGLFAEILPEGLTFLAMSGADACGIMLGDHPRNLDHKKYYSISIDPAQMVGWARARHCYYEPKWVNTTDWQVAAREIAEIRRQQVEKHIADAEWMREHGYTFAIDWEDAAQQLGESIPPFEEEEPQKEPEELQDPYWKF